MGNNFCIKRETIVKRITDAFDKCQDKWESRFITASNQNCFSKKRYNGINVLSLMVTSILNNYSDFRWATPKQIKDAGCKVKDSEYGNYSFIYFAKPVIRKDIAENGIEMEDASEYQAQTGKNPVIWIYNSYLVYNNCQLENPVPLDIKKTSNESAFLKAERIKESSKILFKTGVGSAYYSPLEDYISLPPREHFKSDEGYALTMFHELSHSTGHKSRLNRNLEAYSDKNNRGNEEAIAELSAHFIASGVEIYSPVERQIESADYIKSWLDRTKDKTNDFFSVVRKAEQSADYILKGVTI